MPTLRSKVMVKAMPTKAPALAPAKVWTRETQAGKRKLLRFNEAKAEGFELFSHAKPARNTQATREVKLSARTGTF